MHFATSFTYTQNYHLPSQSLYFNLGVSYAKPQFYNSVATCCAGRKNMSGSDVGKKQHVWERGRGGHYVSVASVPLFEFGNSRHGREVDLVLFSALGHKLLFIA